MLMLLLLLLLLMLLLLMMMNDDGGGDDDDGVTGVFPLLPKSCLPRKFVRRLISKKMSFK